MHIPLLCVGTAIYTVLGYFHFGDILWLVHQNPYKGASLIYGKGKIYHFLIREEFIWGTPIFILLLAGSLWGLIAVAKDTNSAVFRIIEKWIKAFKLQFEVKNISFEEGVLVYGSFFVYAIAHTIFWWKGIFSSLGLIRVLAAVIPVSALISLRGLNVSPLKNLLSKRFYAILFVSAILFIAVYHSQPYLKLKEEDIVIKKAMEWLRTTEFKKEKIYYLHPYVTLEMDLDPFDRHTTGELWGLNPENPELDMPAGSLMLWEGHFAPNEGRIKLEKVLNNPAFTLLNKFAPEKEFIVLGGNKFEVYLFQKQ